jgi:hypothetical protein
MCNLIKVIVERVYYQRPKTVYPAAAVETMQQRIATSFSIPAYQTFTIDLGFIFTG